MSKITVGFPAGRDCKWAVYHLNVWGVIQSQEAVTTMQGRIINSNTMAPNYSKTVSSPFRWKTKNKTNHKQKPLHADRKAQQWNQGGIGDICIRLNGILSPRQVPAFYTCYSHYGYVMVTLKIREVFSSAYRPTESESHRLTWPAVWSHSSFGISTFLLSSLRLSTLPCTQIEREGPSKIPS